METTITLYKVHWYETYRADEQGTRWMLNKPKADNADYKSEIIAEVVYDLPEGFKVKEHLGDKYITKDGEEYEVVTDDGEPYLVGSEIIRLHIAF